MLVAAPHPFIPRHRSSRRCGVVPAVVVAVAVAMVVVVGWLGVRPAFAHSGLAAASPGPGAVVGGEIALIELFYADLILEFDGTVTRQADGEVLDAEAVMTSEITGEFRLAEPLTEPGEYAVRHTVLSIDGDVVEAAYLFSFDPSAPAPVIVFLDVDEGDDDHDDGGIPWYGWVVVGAATVVIVVLMVRLALSIRRARAVTDEPDAA